MREILVHFWDDSEQIIGNIPDDAKVTFGRVNPAMVNEAMYAQPKGQGYCLRIYQKGDAQLAVFTRVSWFRDLALSVKTKKTKSSLAAHSKSDSKGFSQSQQSETSYEWEQE